MEVSEVVEILVKALVDKPEAVKIIQTDSDALSIIEIKVDKQDTGKIIGKLGRTADSIRNIVNCLGSKRKRRYILQID